MSSIFFMAVQCCQCYTMQVKQRKKNSKSNKWVCVVCNQKQSIRKVFGEAPMAKDLRPFVQSSNMSRSHSQSDPPMADPPMADPLPLEHRNNKRPRPDWTEFLDLDHQVSEPGGEFDVGPEIVTELPVKMRSGYKRNNDSKQARLCRENEPMNRREEEEEENDNRSFKEDSKWSRYVTREDCDGAAGDDWKSLTNEEEVGDEEIHPDFL